MKQPMKQPMKQLTSIGFCNDSVSTACKGYGYGILLFTCVEAKRCAADACDEQRAPAMDHGRTTHRTTTLPKYPPDMQLCNWAAGAVGECVPEHFPSAANFSRRKKVGHKNC